MSKGVIIFFVLLVVAFVFGIIGSMWGADDVIEDLYGPSPIDTIKGTRKYFSNNYLKKGKTYGH